jgi:hypothetical protein
MAYGKYKESQIKGLAGTTWYTEIWKKDYIQYITNPNLLSGSTGWILASGVTWINNQGNGALSFDGSQPVVSALASGTTLANSTSYKVTVKLKNVTAGGISIALRGGVSTMITTNGTHEFTMTSGVLSTSPYIYSWSLFEGEVESVYVSPASGEYNTFDMNLEGEGFEVKWTGQGGTRDRQFLTSECVLKFFVEKDDDETFLYNIFESGDKEYFVRIYKNGQTDDDLWWFGWVQPSFDTFSNEPYPYGVNLIATDSIGVYKERKDDILTQAELNSSEKINNHINTFGTTMGLYDTSSSDELAPVPYQHKWFKTSIDWWRDGDTYQSNDPFYLYYTSPGAYRDDIESKPYNYREYDVLKGALKTFNTVGFLSDGAYYFVQPNNLIGNTSGDIRVYPYIGSTDEVPSGSDVGDVTTLLEIDQTINANKGTVLAGSTITYEPIFKSVTVDFINGSASFNVPQGVDLQTEYTAGQLQQADPDVGMLGLYFNVYHRESFLASNVSLNSGYSLENWAIRTTGTLTIKIGTGANTRWLVEGSSATGSASLVWQASAGTITLQRGFNINPNGSLCSNSVSGFVLSSFIYNENYDPTDTVPCNMQYDPDNTTYTAETNIAFQAGYGQVPIPQVSGDITIELDCTNEYWEYNASPPGFSSIHQPVTPTSITRETVANDINMQAVDTQALDGSVGLTYETSQNVNDAYESYDLGEVIVGCSSANSENFADSLYSVKFNGTSGLEIASQGFRRNNTGGYSNISQLLTKEFLELQTEPLEIIQADIYSTDISPLKLVKYSINNDSSYKYYQFLGGTFKAQSETMSGEWYKVESGTTLTPDDPTQIYTGAERALSFDSSIKRNIRLSLSDRENNSYGTIATAASINVAQTKVTLASASKGKIYDNQKVLLCYPDGSNPIVLTADGASTTSDTQIDLDGWTPEIEYPIGCFLLPLSYDLTNVIGGGSAPAGSDTQVQFNDGGAFGGDAGLIYNKTTDTLTATNVYAKHLGNNIGTIYDKYLYLTPADFMQPSSSSTYAMTYTTIVGARAKIRSASYYLQSTFQVPYGMQVRKIYLYGNNANTFTVGASSVSSGAAGMAASGYMGTELTLTTPLVGSGGNYWTISFNPSSTSDEIYGCRITLEDV